MTDLSPYREALTAAGFTVYESSGEIKIYPVVRKQDRQRWYGESILARGKFKPVAEAILRSTVLEVAPGSFVIPIGVTVTAVFRDCHGDGLWIDNQRIKADAARDYPTAWLNAIKALYESGVRWEVKQ